MSRTITAAQKAEKDYEAAAEAFVKAKKAKNPKIYAEAKAKLHKARAAYRAQQFPVDGTVVTPAPVAPQVVVNNGG